MFISCINFIDTIANTFFVFVYVFVIYNFTNIVMF